MTELLAPFGASPGAAKPPANVDAPPPVLITEQQVLFATAAAMPLQPAKTSWLGTMRTFLLAALMTSSKDERPKRRHYPPRSDIFENSRMAREMTRL